MSGVARSERVASINSENDQAAGMRRDHRHSLKVCIDGRSAITTPKKPIRIALQRRQPTRSRRNIADSAVTNTGQAR